MSFEPENYTLTYEPHESYLRVFAKGDLTRPETRAKAWKTIVTSCRRRGHDKLLVVQDSPGNSSDLDAYASAVMIADIGLKGLQIAFVDTVPEHQSHNKFAELVGSNRGIFGRVFSDEAEAKGWLLD